MGKRVFYLDASLLQELFTDGNAFPHQAFSVQNGIPAEAKLVTGWYSTLGNGTFSLLFEHPDWTETEPPPLVPVLVTRTQNEKSSSI